MNSRIVVGFAFALQLAAIRDSLAQAQAGTVKARDEIALTYQFVALADEQAPLQATLKAVASQNGEDLLRPLVSQVAAKAVNAALSPKP